ncbi:MAG: hypothetical protein QOD83_530 [Solirubrobacteraceae bacterium]|jgi:hypothetical protein|nr:hypothetical protein [Solirubrobacteraceae bacterium]
MSDTANLEGDHATPVAHAVELVASKFARACDVQQVIAADGDLVELLLDGAGVAHEPAPGDIEARCSSRDVEWVRCWSGEHYRLLTALSEVLAPDDPGWA